MSFPVADQEIKIVRSIPRGRQRTRSICSRVFLGYAPRAVQGAYKQDGQDQNSNRTERTHIHLVVFTKTDREPKSDAAANESTVSFS